MTSVPVPITVDGDTYTVPGADTIEPLAVSVTFDGTNAGGDFLPCLSYYTQAGQLISRTFPASAVTAGSSAEVSFIPFVPPASGGSAGASYYKATQKLGVDTTTITFAGIPQTFTTLRLEWTATAVDNTEEQVILARFNDAAASGDYHWHVTSPNGTGDQTDITSTGVGGITTRAALGFMSCDDNDYTDYFSTGQVEFPDYTSADGASIGYHGHGAAGIPDSLDPDVWISGGYRTAAGPLTKITFVSIEANGLGGNPIDFKAGSRFTLLAF